MTDRLTFVARAYGLQIHSFILMSNHYHMIVTTPGSNLSEAMREFQKYVSLQITTEANRINQLWARRFIRSEIKTNEYFSICYRYLYQNPIRANIANQVEEYKYSTLYGLLGRGRLSVPVCYDANLFTGSIESNLDWLNERLSDEENERVRRGLKRPTFKPPPKARYLKVGFGAP